MSRVRIHADAAAASLARQIDAEAFTASEDIFFAAQRFSPSTTQGQRLLAHELAHVGQQTGLQPAPIQRVKSYREELEAIRLPKLSAETVTELETLSASDKASDRQAAIDKIVSAAGLTFTGVAGKPRYDPDMNTRCRDAATTDDERRVCDSLRGRTVKDYRMPMGRDVVVEIGPEAFESVDVLYSTIWHEFVHVEQHTGLESGPSKNASEVEAEYFELKQASATGIAARPDEIAGIFSRLREHFLKLEDPERARFETDYAWARSETLRLLLEHAAAAPTPAELSIILAGLKELKDTVGGELSTAEKEAFDAQFHKGNEKVFLAELARTDELSSEDVSILGVSTLKFAFEGMSASDQKRYEARYVTALERVFVLVETAIKDFKSKSAGVKKRPGTFDFGALDLLTARMMLETVFNDLTPGLKAKLEKRFNAAMGRVEVGDVK